MAGTRLGGRKAAATNLASGPDFYRRIGRKGGRNGNTGGFAANPELARRAGKIGGARSRRGRSMQPTGTLQDGLTVIVRGNSMKHQFTIGERIRVTNPGEQTFLGVSMDGSTKWYIANKDVTIDRP